MIYYKLVFVNEVEVRLGSLVLRKVISNINKFYTWVKEAFNI